MNHVSFIIQARMSSSRLPSKILFPFFDDKNTLDLLTQKLKDNFPNIPIILATSHKKDNDVLEKYARDKSLLVFRGDENDVLSRFINAAKQFNIEKIIRICSDNPFLDIKELHKLVNFIETNDLDYVSFNVNGIPSIKTHFGFWAECVSFVALKNVAELTQETLYHEHVTNYIYENPNLFTIRFLLPNINVIGKNDIRMTLDTIDDFQTLSKIYSLLSTQYDEFGIDEIISFLNENPQYKDSMNRQIAMNSK
ncbi:MAG: hypothetical protein EZS26_001264 [Candidatus Ordinivivax streblomastigis]|uniref:Uncharacterized protein n=1 Tax=Candidatus Ordinivivax streblomastigis TaxID=2540710 RepID=A0A5M8P251_9BACT|nr:MAG: hypothetical protein EZS26_001264 [Candidatus Ordinivivax streblomastigis]